MGAVWHASKVSALRRELNSHEQIKPRGSALLCHASCRRFEGRIGWYYQQFCSLKLARTKEGRLHATWPQRRCASESRRTTWDKTDFSQFIGPPETAVGFASHIAGGLKMQEASTCSAERKTAVSPQQELQGPKSTAHCAQRRLTPHSRRGPTASRQARRPALYIIQPPGLASYRRSRLNSNVRPRKAPNSYRHASWVQPCLASTFASAVTPELDLARPAALTSFGVRGDLPRCSKAHDCYRHCHSTQPRDGGVPHLKEHNRFWSGMVYG